MNGFCLRIYMCEFTKHKKILLYEWILEKAKSLGIKGGSAFRAIAGYGRHKMLHEEHFFELASDLPVVVEFITNEEEANLIINYLKEEKLNLLYIKVPIEYEILT